MWNSGSRDSQIHISREKKVTVGSFTSLKYRTVPIGALMSVSPVSSRTCGLVRCKASQIHQTNPQRPQSLILARFADRH